MKTDAKKKDIAVHHAHVVVGDIERISPILQKFVAEVFNFSISANPDFFREQFETLTIDDSRRIQQIHASKPFSADIPRIFIIEMYGATREAQNALLKIIEEPQPGNYFFFVVSSAHILLPTVLSRVQVLEIGTDADAKTQKDNAADFIRIPLAEKIAFVDDIAAQISDEKILKHEAVAFLNELEKTLYDSWTKNRTDENQTARSASAQKKFEAIARARDYMNDRAPSVKMLLEYVAVSL